MSEKGTEQATPQRQQKAREQGDFVRSRELLSSAAMLAGILALRAVSSSFLGAWSDVYSQSVRLATMRTEDASDLWRVATKTMLVPALPLLFVVLAAAFAAALAVGIAQGGGIAFYPNTLALKFERFNPVTNIQNMFSLRAVTRLLKSLLPAAAMALFGWSALRRLMMTMPVMSQQRLPEAFGTAYSLALKASFLMLFWSVLDYAVEWRSRNERLKMTKQEVRQEMKDASVSPEVKARMRQIQRTLRRRRIKEDISRASVVITNPTHYAVALEFSFETMQAPTVLAKGRDLHAADIREEAIWAGIPIVENPPLARSLYRMAEPGQSIPFELYATVAGILAFLYRQKVEEKLRQERARAAAAQQAPPPAQAPQGGL